MNAQVETERALISVVIPCYQQAHYLGNAIESALAQTYPAVEIIVVDDGSPDNTPQVAQSYPQVRYVYQYNQGLSAARNTGLHHSRGQYLVFLDADDQLLPEALATGFCYLVAHPEMAFASGHFRYVQADGTFLSSYPQPQVTDDHYCALLRGNYIGMHATVIYRRDVLESSGGFDVTLPACEDYDLYLRLARHFAVGQHPAMVAEYRIHGTNMSHNPLLMLQAALRVLHRQRDAVEQKGSPEERAAYEAGLRFWQEHYSEQLVAQLDEAWQQRRLQTIVRALPQWLRYAPRQSARAGMNFVKRRAQPLPAKLPPLHRLAAHYAGQSYLPPVGQVRWGDLRRTTPMSREFGFERGQPVDRYYIDEFLARHTADIGGRVLEVGDNAYTRQFGAQRVTQSDVLHVPPGTEEATIVADLSEGDNIPSDTFDCIILTQTLHLIYEPRAALLTLRRILTPGGVLLVTVPGISQVSVDEWAEQWYWSFTMLALKRLLAETFAPESITPEPISVESYGNVLAATAFLQGIASAELNRAELDVRDPCYQVVIAARAVKAAGRYPDKP
jgi:SAM-dependent methyltransferase